MQTFGASAEMDIVRGSERCRHGLDTELGELILPSFEMNKDDDSDV